MLVEPGAGGDRLDDQPLAQASGVRLEELVESLLRALDLPATSLRVDVTDHADFPGFDREQVYVVRYGSLVARYRGRVLYTLEPGDMLLPQVAATVVADEAVYHGSDEGALLDCYAWSGLQQRLADTPAAVSPWTQLLQAYAGLMLRVACVRVPQEDSSEPGHETYQPGDIIINQGDRADDVFTMTEGVAEVLVEGVTVGRIGSGEIFGAMAALTHAERSATVQAKTRCMVVKFPKEQFTELIRSNPGIIHSLLRDMANSIVNLNEQLVGLRGQG